MTGASARGARGGGGGNSSGATARESHSAAGGGRLAGGPVGGAEAKVGEGSGGSTGHCLLASSATPAPRLHVSSTAPCRSYCPLWFGACCPKSPPEPAAAPPFCCAAAAASSMASLDDEIIRPPVLIDQSSSPEAPDTACTSPSKVPTMSMSLAAMLMPALGAPRRPWRLPAVAAARSAGRTPSPRIAPARNTPHAHARGRRLPRPDGKEVLNAASSDEIRSEKGIRRTFWNSGGAAGARWFQNVRVPGRRKHILTSPAAVLPRGA